MSTALAPEPVKPKEPLATSKKEMVTEPRQTIVLKGFIRKSRVNSSYEGICLTLNLAVCGHSLEETDQKLHALIVAYLEDAAKTGHWAEMIPRRAPASYYIEYYRLRLLSHFNSLVDFKLFVQSVPPCTAHA